MPVKRTVLRPRIDVPLEVVLDNSPSQAKEVTGNYGTDFQHTVNRGENLLYLPHEAQAQLIRTQAAAGDLIEVLKSMRGKQEMWQVRVLPDAQEPSEPVDRGPWPVDRGPQTQSDGPPATGHRPPASVRVLAPARPVAVPSQPTNGANAIAPQAAEPQLHRPAAQLISACLYAAIDSAIAAEKYAHEKGYPLELTGEDIRAIAVHLSIKAEGR
jgi:hypothetical protein